MEKILLLGGSAQQVIAIRTAKRLGYETVLCDYLPDNPGQYVADHFYLTSTTDMEAVLQIARKEQVNGVLAYASDPAAPTAAYVAEKLGLPGNTYLGVSILCNKDRFRRFLKENGFCSPEGRGYQTPEEARKDLEEGVFRLPVIIKPVDSSGSKGVTVLHCLEQVNQAIEFAFSFSRGGRIIVEEYIAKKHPYLIGGDIFVHNGEVILWGLLNCHRDDKANPLVPVGKSFPLELPEEDQAHVHRTIQDLVTKLGFQNGPMNVELVVDQANRVWPIDIGPRSGGNMIPDLLGLIFQVDVVEMSVLAAMGKPLRGHCHPPVPYYATHNLHAVENGTFRGIWFSREILSHIVRKAIYKEPGDLVEFFDNASKAVGIVFLKFDSLEQMQRMLEEIGRHIVVQVDKTRKGDRGQDGEEV